MADLDGNGGAGFGSFVTGLMPLGNGGAGLFGTLSSLIHGGGPLMFGTPVALPPLSVRPSIAGGTVCACLSFLPLCLAFPTVLEPETP